MYLVCGEALYDVFVESENACGDLYLKGLVGGSPYNVSIGIARLGGNSALFTAISGDMLGARLVSRLELEGVATHFLRRSGRRTTISLVGLDEGGQPAYVFYGTGSADCNVTVNDLPDPGPEVSGFHFGSYSLVVKPAADAFSVFSDRNRNRLISVDPNVRLNVEPDVDLWRERFDEYAGRAHLIKISSEDLALLYADTKPQTLVDRWLGMGVKLVVLTNGGDNVTAWTHADERVSHSPRATKVVDTVGAGDSFQSALLVKLSEVGGGNPLAAVMNLDSERLRDILAFSSDAAGITCTRRGADLPRRSEVDVANG